MLFHVNPATGEPGQCSATRGGCPFGSTDEHFTSAAAARADFERTMEKATMVAQKKDGRSIRGNWPDLELYRGQFDKHSEIFVHPQGKIAFTRGPNWARLNVMKNGKKATTGGSLEDLRDGRGGWIQVKKMNDLVPAKEDYERDYSSNPTVTVEGKRVSVAGTLTPKEKANVDAGYPKTSPYDPLNNAITVAPRERRYSPGGYRYAILPLNERGNPHKLAGVKIGEGLRYWNGKDRNGDETVDSTFEVWTDDAGNHKAVVTYGTEVPQLGSTSGFQHDQTQRTMGGSWRLIGAFQPIENGAIIGEVPNKSMPIYTYK